MSDSGRTVRIKAVTVWQPWASLLALGERGPKRFETRPGRTRYRGPIAIHAGLRQNCYLGRDREFFLAVAAGFGYTDLQHLLSSFHRLPYGAIVGVGWLHDCREVLDDTWRGITKEERILGDYTPGRFIWDIRHMRALEQPITTRGYQGLWEWDAPAELVERLAA